MAHSPTGKRFTSWHWLIITAVCATFVIVLVAYLYWPILEREVTVTHATIHIVEGKTPADWFGSPSINETTGYPFRSTTGAAFTVPVHLINFDYNETHVIVGVNISSPFVFVGTSPSLPLYVGPEDSVLFNVTVDCPPTVGTYALNITLSAL